MRRVSRSAAVLLVTIIAAGAAGAAASAETLNVSGTWNANYHCEVGWCAGEDFPAPGVVLTQAPGSNIVSDGTSSGTLVGNELTLHSGSPGEYQFDQTLIFSADGESWTGPLSDSNGTSGTDTGTRVSGEPFEISAQELKEAQERKEKEAKEAAEKAKRASASTVSCYVPLLAIGAAWECTATVADASGNQPPATPTGTVAFPINFGFTGGFAGAHECTLKPSESGPTAYCTVLFVPGQEIPIGSPAPIAASYGGSSAFRASSSSAQATVVNDEPTQAQTGCGASTSSAHVDSLVAPLAGARVAAATLPVKSVVIVGNPKLARKQHSLSRVAANKRAIALLHPSKAGSKAGVRLYGLPQSLAAGSKITEATLGLGKEIVRPLQVDERAWIYWEDLQPLARYEHPSVLLVVSAKGGRVLARASFVTYPEIDGKVAKFVTSNSHRLLVYARSPSSRHKHRLTKAKLAAIVLAAKEGQAAERGGKKKAHKADASHSTLITLVDHVSGGKGDTFENEESAITYTFAQHGVATQGVTTVNALSSAVESATARGQNNVTIFLDGHGVSAESSTLPTVVLGGNVSGSNGTVSATAGTVTSADLTAIVRAHPDVQFNFIIDSCYSGRFVDPLKQEANVGAVLTSSSANEISRSPLQLEYEGGPNSASGERGLVITKTAGKGEDRGLVVAPTSQHNGEQAPGGLVTPNGEKLTIGNDDSHEGISPFTSGVVAAINQAYVGQGAGADLTAILTDARTLEPTYDLAATGELTHPSPEPTSPAPQYCTVPAPAETPSGGWFTGQ